MLKSTDEVMFNIVSNIKEKIFDYDFFIDECKKYLVPTLKRETYYGLIGAYRDAHYKHQEISVKEAYALEQYIPENRVFAEELPMSVVKGCSSCGGGSVR